jgi:hypothetical protein
LKLKQAKLVIQPDIAICRRWQIEEEHFLDYKDKEHPMLVVFCRPEAKGGKDLIQDLGKMLKSLREIAIKFQQPNIKGVVTNFKEWHFMHFSLQQEVSVVFGG